MAFKDKKNRLALYSQDHDPDQERSAKEIARFSQKDAETWLEMIDIGEERRVARRERR